MQRVESTTGTGVRFERRETDGRDHPAWILAVGIAPGSAAGTVAVDVHLHYGGAPSLPGVDRLLGQEIGRAGARLQQVLDAG